MQHGFNLPFEGVRETIRFARWPLRWFKVVEESMRPALGPGDGLVAMRGGAPRTGQLRVFRDPRLSDALARQAGRRRPRRGRGAIFEARSDNPQALGAVDSHEFGWVPAAGSYRVVWTVRAAAQTTR